MIGRIKHISRAPDSVTALRTLWSALWHWSEIEFDFVADVLPADVLPDFRISRFPVDFTQILEFWYRILLMWGACGPITKFCSLVIALVALDPKITALDRCRGLVL